MESLFSFFGRLHPILLHLPIGILVLAFTMALLSKREHFKSLSAAVGFSLQIGMWTAIGAAISGYVLSLEGGYDENLLWQHKWLGMGTAIVGVLVYFLHRVKSSKVGEMFYWPVFYGLMVLIGATGHIGGSLTHGSAFLSEVFTTEKGEKKPPITDIQQADVYQEVVMPIFEQKCINCHNSSKLKGELLMTSIEGIKAGGETGVFLQVGSIANSLFLQRIHLPLEEKEHMPPKGKKQLTSNEIRLLEWWVEQGAHFDKKVKDLAQTEKIQSILKKYEDVDKGVFKLAIVAANKGAISALQEAGIQITKVAKDKAFLTASLRGKKDLDKSIFTDLVQISNQLIELDLSNTNLTDDLLLEIQQFPHLTKLLLQKTDISGKHFDVLKNLSFLEKLNLYSTSVDDEALVSLTNIKTLKNLWLWDTNVSDSAIKQLKKTRPDITIDLGINPSIFGKGKLKTPLIVVDNDLFEDSVLVEFDFNFRGIDVFYTLDGTPPDSSAQQYEVPFWVSQTSTIQVFATKPDWYPSEVVAKPVVRINYRPQAIQLNKNPADQYKGEGASTLINLRKGTTDFTDGEWLGYEKSHFTAVLDMGEAKEISSVAISALEATSSYIFFPKKIEISLSEDNKNYHLVSRKSIPTTEAPAPPLTNIFIQQFPTEKAQFVKVKVYSNLVNPDWHPAPGAGCWVFIDEVMVE